MTPLCLEEDRENARLLIAACIYFTVFFVQLITGSTAVMPLTFFLILFLLYLCFIVLLKGKKKILNFSKSTLSFSIFMSCFSVSALYGSLLIARPGYIASSKVELVLIARMDSGEIPCSILMVMLLPIMATHVGMIVWWAKLSGLCCVILVGVICMNVYLRPLDVENNGTSNMRNTSFVFDLLCYIGFIGVSVIANHRERDISESYIARLRANSLADSILNHILKARNYSLMLAHTSSSNCLPYSYFF